MDELQAIRELYGEPQADPFLAARVRRRLESGSRRRRRRLPWTAALAGLAAAAAATVIAVPGVIGLGQDPGTAGRAPGASGQPGGPEAASTTLSGRSILLAAASTAAAEPAVPGSYWRVRKLYRQTHPERLGRGQNRYWVVESRLTEQWVARDGRVWSGSRTLGTHPASAADEAAWRRDGSPAEWSSRGRVLSTSPEKGRLREATGKVPFSMAGREMTTEQIRGLPADPAALREWVGAAVREAGIGGGETTLTSTAGPTGGTAQDAPGPTGGTAENTPGGSPEPDDGVVADALSGLLWSKPSPPAVRAAAYRALAELPNVRYLGEATDERGRRGAAFSFTTSFTTSSTEQVTVQRTLIIDPGSSQVLSSTTTGLPGVKGEQVEVVLKAGWTDDEPSPPGLLR
ncbi:hypothetical protein GCM10010156_59400 [Planobispora rosea]|uniref:CU044_5270 family protein n=1 Tax=Planobispora rosea TaxID=35762 RepID=A0A8J3WFX9_PLARO|nr:CU044_5270 family protein [Planobispora rosea]GGS93273.1 hypothetical protein GCM10010156_59400 [Planobispora rosea]GIH87242.1 hypothetical protein Pro02_56500 [Planobispora rosea]